MEEQSCNSVAAEYIPPSSSSLLPLPYSQGGGGRGERSDTHGHGNDDACGMMMADSSYLPNRSKKYLCGKEVSIEGDAEEGKEGGERKEEETTMTRKMMSMATMILWLRTNRQGIREGEMAWEEARMGSGHEMEG